MARLETWYKQDLKKPLIVHKHADVFNHDSQGNLIGVEVYSDGEPVTLTGSISGYCLLADGTTVPAVGASRSGNKASVLIPQTAYNVPGVITVTIKNVDGNDITTLCAVVGLVRQSVSGNLVNPGSVVTDWSNSINAQLQAVQDAADNVGAIVAAPFAENTVYVAGNYVTNNGNLYRITGDHAAGVTWANTQKVQCTVGTELYDLKAALGIESIPLLNDYLINTNYTINETEINLTPTSSSTGYKCAVIDCVENDAFTINGKGGSNPLLWAFINNQNILIKKSESNLTGQDLVIVAPANAHKLIVNFAATSTNPYIFRGTVTKEQIRQLNEESNRISGGVLTFGSKAVESSIQVLDIQHYASNPYRGYVIYTDTAKAVHIIGTGSELSAFALTEIYNVSAGDKIYIGVTGGCSLDGVIGFYDGSSIISSRIQFENDSDININSYITINTSGTGYLYIFIRNGATVDLTVRISDRLFRNELVLSPNSKMINDRLLSDSNHELWLTDGDRSFLINAGVDLDRLWSMPYITGGLYDRIDFDAGTIDLNGLIVTTPGHFWTLPDIQVEYNPDDRIVKYFVWNYVDENVEVYSGSYEGRYLCLFGIFFKRIISPYAYRYEENKFIKPFPMKGELVAQAVVYVDTVAQTFSITNCAFLLGSNYVHLGNVESREFTYVHTYPHMVYYDGTNVDIIAETQTSGYNAAFQQGKIPIFYFYHRKFYGLQDGVTVYIDGVQVHGAISSGLDNQLVNQKMAFLGDSITEGVGAGGNNGAYPRWIGDKLGCTVVNVGLSGSAIVEAGQAKAGFIERVPTIPDDCTVVCFMGGTNDYWQDRPLGIYGDTTSSTFYGALDVLINALQNRFPSALIYAVVPPMGYQPNNRFDMETKPNIGSFEDVRTAIIKMAAKYALPVLDMMHDSGLNPKNEGIKSAFFSDGVHLKAAGEKVLADMHIGFLRTHCRYTW